jgi:predicted nucleic acid-binding protein
MNVFLDSNAVIYFFEGTPSNQLAVRKVLSALEAEHGELSLVVSRLTVMECKVKPLRDQNLAMLASYEAYFAPLTVIELSAAVVEAATHIRAFYGLKTPDALLAACALSLDKNLLFVTADAAFGRVPNLVVTVIPQ